MNAPDTNGWIKGLDDAPKDDAILVCVPCVDDDDLDYRRAIAWWNEDENRWDGEWRYVEVEDSLVYEECEPTHWKPLNLPVEYEQEAEVAIAAAV